MLNLKREIISTGNFYDKEIKIGSYAGLELSIYQNELYNSENKDIK